MAYPGTVKIGDEVRHPDWSPGITRMVTDLIQLQFRGKTPIVVVVDKPVYPNGCKPKGIIMIGQYDRCFEGALEVVKPSNIFQLSSKRN